MEVIVYDRDMMRLGVIDDFKSLLWNRKYFDVGEFQLYAPLNADNIEMLQPGNLVTYKGSVEAGIIDYIELDDSANARGIMCKGKFLKYLMNQRVCQWTHTYSGTAETAMYGLLDVVTPMPLVEPGTNHGYTEPIDIEVTWKNMYQIGLKISKTSGIGLRLRPDFTAKKIIYETYKGVDHSKGQKVNPQVIFSPLYANVEKTIYQYDNTYYKNYAIVGGEGEGSERKMVYVDQTITRAVTDRREAFVDAKDIRSTDFATTAEYEAALRQRGLENLASNIPTQSIEYATAGDSNFTYKIDYDLGDIVTYEKPDWNLAMDQRIIEIQEIYETGGLTVRPTLGQLTETVEWS